MTGEVVEQEIRPALQRVDAIGADAARATSLAAAPAARVDQFVRRLVADADEAVAEVRDSLGKPARAFLVALRTALIAYRYPGETPAGAVERGEQRSNGRTTSEG